MDSSTVSKIFSEALGTALLVFIGCGAIVLDGTVLHISLAFGSVMCLCYYTISQPSGCHLNPIISLACFIAGSLPVMDFVFYFIGQFVGSLVGAALLIPVLKSTDLGMQQLGSNFYGPKTSADTKLFGAIYIEIILSLIYAYTVVCIYNNGKLKKVAGFLAGLMLTFVHLLGTRLTFTSVNPCRSFGPALFKCGDAIKKVWVFLIFPLVGGAIAGLLYKLFGSKSESKDEFKSALIA
jgi:aquaporin Z